MEEKSSVQKKESFPLKVSKIFLTGTLFLIFGSKKWKKGKRPIPPVYIVAGIILALILILVFKRPSNKPRPYYPPRPYQYTPRPRIPSRGY